MVRAGVVVALATMSSGCLTLYSKTEVVRGNERRTPIQFECTEAADAFQSAMKKEPECVGGTGIGVPFVTFYSKHQKLAPSAIWNDAVAKCDTDQNGTITLMEAQIYAKSAD